MLAAVLRLAQYRAPKFWLVLALLTCWVGSLTGCSEGDPFDRLESYQIDGSTMGTYYRVTARCEKVTSQSALASDIEKTLVNINEVASNYLADSEISQLNRLPTHQWALLSPDLANILHASKDVYEASQGTFDITVAPLVQLWGFGANANAELPPSAEVIGATMQQIGLDGLELAAVEGSDNNGSGTTRARRVKDITLDLSAVAKGYAVDQVSQKLATLGCPAHLVDIGGEVRGRGASAAGRPWRVGIEIPDPQAFGGIAQVLSLADVAVATSGDYRNFIDAEDQRWSHTIDPRTGQPVQHGLASVSVVHAQAALADAWATALSVAGPQKALELAEAEGLAVLLLTRDTQGFTASYTPAMAKHLLADE